MSSKLSLKDKLRLAKEASASLVRGTRATRRGQVTDDLSLCHGERSDPLQVRQRDPTHCYHGAGAAVIASPTSWVPMALSVAAIAGGGMLLWSSRDRTLVLLALLLILGGMVGLWQTYQ